ncbi:hypothetical protein A3D01_00390 [Candidatus Woesebacteria bacterium RIFCSPHIGHO2_02_FULL_39_13]|uniref:SGNH hydrolase-type esterase domain-containing protein n=1 Tax=Candidatus Woesebacteria bacterium RIFCSPHIGHO2_02_FULL_39_13 TaxID=1802505 RepID=A0A1F7Z3I6_9BACT|nr:MAG: hypothetical protein A3D01_00390 [Candidatus Woesebacteria bacterium RIFCSPHIGHO2_02_FULL_39_13]OGM75054.1 MAG: hypothetical protein A3H19_04805 [Candidatus Woesebacteria bacterium RIFCSPLOWO2_12_FULL_39_9]
MRKLFIFIVIIQFVAISILVVYIFQKRNKVLGVQFNPINQNDIVVATDSGKLKYFYQPPSNYTERVKNTWIADEVIYTYNSDTLNERYDYQIQKPPKSFRIVTLGDSFTFGLYVNTKDNYPEKLEDKLNSVCNNNPNVEVINLGMQGYDIEYSVERYKKRGVKYQPDLVIWFINSWNYLKINELVRERINTLYDEVREKGELDEMIEKEGVNFGWKLVKNELESGMTKDILVDKQFQFFNNFRNNYYQNNLIIMTFSDELKSEKNYPGYIDFIEKIIKHDEKISLFPTLPYNRLITLKADPHPDSDDYDMLAEKIVSFLANENILKCN